MKASLIASSVLIASLVSPALAYVDLPTTAKPVPATDLTKEYSGKTLTARDFQMYCGTDGKVIGFSSEHNAIADGTWDVVDGKFCYHASWMGAKPGDKPYPMNNCWGYMTDGKQVFHQFTSDKMKSDTGWWGGPSPHTFKPGNTIQAKYDALKAKIH